MATYVLGDIHGQLAALERLVARLPFDRDRDRLWLVGDLVNRGPDSLGVLRWARRTHRKMKQRMKVVLGNHDVLLLALAAGVGEPRPKDSLSDILEAPDRDELCDWLRGRPLVHRRRNDVMVHGGLPPSWTVKKALKRARKVEDALQGDGALQLLSDWQARRPVDDRKRERRRRALSLLTSLRTCTTQGMPCDWSGPPDGAPTGCLPWFRIPGRRSENARIIFGHWAALGLHLEPRVLGLDSGAAWRGRLTALRLDDGVVFQESVGLTPA